MIFLHLGIWSPCDDAYDWMNFKINEFALQDKLSKIREKYSIELLSLLQDMLQIDENIRPDFVTLDAKLNSFMHLKGKRVCQTVKPINLLQSLPQLPAQSNV